MNISTKEVLPIAELTFHTNRCLFIKGQGGGGKTSIACNIIGPALGREVWLVNLSGQGPQEVIGYGLPQPNGDMLFSAPCIWPTEARVGNRPVLLILDEFPDYDSDVRALLRGVFPASGARYVGPHKLGSDVAIILTGNRKVDGAKGAVEEAPFTERCVNVVLTPTVDDWLAYYGTQPALVNSQSFVPSFLTYGAAQGNKGVDHFNPPIVSPYLGEAHPCPRTWEAVVLAEHARKSQPAIYRALVTGSVGRFAANAYFGFLEHVDRLPDIQAIKRGDHYVIPTDPAGQFALANACVNFIKVGADAAIDLAAGHFDWFVDLLLQLRGDIRMFAAVALTNRGVPLDNHPKSHRLITL